MTKNYPEWLHLTYDPEAGIVSISGKPKKNLTNIKKRKMTCFGRNLIILTRRCKFLRAEFDESNQDS